MRKIWVVVLFLLLVIPVALISFQAGVFSQNYAEKDIEKIDIPIKKLLEQPVEGSKTTYDVPIGMRIVARTADKKWYKARISYNFIGYFEYEGWVRVN